MSFNPPGPLIPLLPHTTPPSFPAANSRVPTAGAPSTSSIPSTAISWLSEPPSSTTWIRFSGTPGSISLKSSGLITPITSGRPLVRPSPIYHIWVEALSRSSSSSNIPLDQSWLLILNRFHLLTDSLSLFNSSTATFILEILLGGWQQTEAEQTAYEKDHRRVQLLSLEETQVRWWSSRVRAVRQAQQSVRLPAPEQAARGGRAATSQRGGERGRERLGGRGGLPEHERGRAVGLALAAGPVSTPLKTQLERRATSASPLAFA
ncbi:hypothetical protein NLJ89_g10339 [Agrocybe chaxingu]|uniref:Uncharacterized protein n=1 Tax=Agrocybe chaxingu TaxID=84603 RepID=A0A9W8JRX4_9AGAR|nr:hypothetical protein NLJ89_g10339 [Agrocybe chaxingu]